MPAEGPIQLIVGLGNPGPRYARTRHNIGFEAADALARAWQAQWRHSRRFKGEWTELPLGECKLRLLKPHTYMNRSGEAIRAALDWYKLAPQAVLPIYDDMDLSVGHLRLRPAGSAGSHNGMKSAIAHLGTQQFPRLRLGIGSPSPGQDSVAYVLGRFSPQEIPRMRQVLDRTVALVELALERGLEPAMSRYNGPVADA